MVSVFRKPRSDAKLMALDPEDELRLLQWICTPGCSYLQVRALCAKSRAEGGLEIKTSVGALSAFWQARGPEYLIRRRREARTLADAVAGEAAGAEVRWDDATIDLLRQQAFALAQNPNVDPGDVKKIFGLVLKARDQDLQARKVAILEKRAALADQAETITRDASLSPADREAKMRQLFSLGS